MTPFRRNLLFGSYCAALALAYGHDLRALYDHSRQDETASHIVLIPLVACGLIVLRRKWIFASVQTAWQGGLGIIVLGVALLITAKLYRPSLGQDDSLTLVVGALIVMLIGGFLLSYGRKASRAALFPLLFLGFMVPIPNALLDGAVWFLKNGSTETVAGLFTLTGTLYHRDAFAFSLPNMTIEVADACSGIRSSIALLLTSLLAGHIYLDKGWKKVVLVLAIVPLAILKNAIRIVTLSLLAIHVDRRWITGNLHHDGGVVFFLVSLALLAPVVILLRKTRTPQPVSNNAIVVQQEFNG